VAYEKESRESIQQESTRLREDEASLKPFLYSLDPPVTVYYNGFLTMIDGKVLQVGNDSFHMKKFSFVLQFIFLFIFDIHLVSYEEIQELKM